MKYRHAHHAGNFADALKHLVLLELLTGLGRKDTPFLYLETHAGRGRYALPPGAERRQGEFAEGVGHLLDLSPRPPLLKAYLDEVERLGSDGQGALKTYPGSPLLAASQLRPQDRAVLVEIRSDESRALQRNLDAFPNVTVLCGDGYGALRANLPPRERRGLVLIDPPYEQQEGEFDVLLEALADAVTRWSTGVYAIWYPIKRRAPIDAFHARLAALRIRRILCAELNIFREDSRVSLNGCGVIVVNAPWKTDESLGQTLPELHRALGGRAGTSARCFWLVPE